MIFYCIFKVQGLYHSDNCINDIQARMARKQNTLNLIMITEISEILGQRTGTDYGTVDASVPDLGFRTKKPEASKKKPQVFVVLLFY